MHVTGLTGGCQGLINLLHVWMEKFKPTAASSVLSCDYAVLTDADQARMIDRLMDSLVQVAARLGDVGSTGEIITVIPSASVQRKNHWEGWLTSMERLADGGMKTRQLWF